MCTNNNGSSLLDQPEVKPVKNFGHGRRSNLQQKAQQMQRSRAQSLAVDLHDLQEFQENLQSYISYNERNNAVPQPPTIPTLQLGEITRLQNERKQNATQ